MRDIEIAKMKDLRATIIVQLYNLYGSNITLAVLKNLLRYKSLATESDIIKALDYLKGKEKEYIEFRKNEKEFLSSVVKLTPKGVNLAEGDLKDIGVIFSYE